MIISKIKYTNEEIRALQMLAVKYSQVENELKQKRKIKNQEEKAVFSLESEQVKGTIKVYGLSDGRQTTVLCGFPNGEKREISKDFFYSICTLGGVDYEEVKIEELSSYTYKQENQTEQPEKPTIKKLDISDEALKLEVEKYKKSIEKDKRLEALAEEVIKGDLSHFDNSLNLNDLLTMYRHVEHIATTRYLKAIKFDCRTALNDLEETLSKYTVTDLKKALREYNKTVIHSYVGNQIENTPNTKEKTATDENRRKAQLAQAIAFCIADLTSFFRGCEIVIYDMLKELTEERLGSLIGDFSPLTFDFVLEDGTIIDLEEEIKKTPLAENLREWALINTSEEADKLERIAFARLTAGYLKQREDQNKKLREKRTRNKYIAPDSSIDNQITIEELVNNIEEFKPAKKETENLITHFSIQKRNNITEAVNGITPKQKQPDIDQMGTKKAHYKNGPIDLIIEPDLVKKSGHDEPEQVLKYIKRNSPKIMSYGISKFYEQNNKEDLLRALDSKDRPAVTVRFSLNEMMRHFNVDPEDTIKKKHFKQAWADTCGLWQRGTLRVEGSKGFTQASIIAEFGAEKGENGGNLFIVFPKTVWKELIFNNTGEYYLPWTRYQLDPLEYQIYLYIASHAQYFKNVANDKAPVTYDRNTNRITIHRSVKSIIENAPSLDLEEKMKNDPSHILRDISGALEEALTKLCGVAFYEGEEDKDAAKRKNLFVSWRYKEDDPESTPKKTGTNGGFKSYHDWLNSIIVIEMNAPDNFENNLIESTKNLKKRVLSSNNKKKKKEENKENNP